MNVVLTRSYFVEKKDRQEDINHEMTRSPLPRLIYTERLFIKWRMTL